MQQLINQPKFKYWPAVLSGLFIGFTYIPFPAWAVLFGYVPLFWFWQTRAQNAKEAAIAGFITQFILNLIGFNWILHTAHEFGALPWPVAFLAFLAFALLAHLHFAVIGAIFLKLERKLPSSPLLQGLFISILFVLFEHFWPYLFQWHLGYALLQNSFPLIHFADLIGFHGLSLALFIFNSLITAEIILFKSRNLFFKKMAIFIFAFFILNLTGSYYGNLWTQEPFHKFKTLVIQANIGNLQRMAAEKGRGYQNFILNEYVNLTKQALEKHPHPDLIMWPESAMPDYLDNDFKLNSRPAFLRQFVQSINIPLLTGAYSKTTDENQQEEVFNAVFLFDAQGELTAEPYRKTHLLAYGEYTPFADWFPALKTISPAGDGFSRGQGPTVLDLNGTKLGPQICYEALYHEFSQKLAKKEADLLVNVTNDSWFGPYLEPRQHLLMTYARALETRRSLVRATNTGHSGAILYDGTFLEPSPLFKPWFGEYELKVLKSSSLTVYTQIGDILPLIYLLLALGILVYGYKKHRTP